MLEARPYGPESTEQEREAIRHRVRAIADDVVLYDEVPVQSVFQIELMFGELREVTAELPRFYYVIDLCNAQRPPAELRLLLKARFKELHHRILHTAVVTGKNFMLNVAIKFVFNGFGFHSYTVHRTHEQALAEIERVRRTS